MSAITTPITMHNGDTRCAIGSTIGGNLSDKRLGHANHNGSTATTSRQLYIPAIFRASREVPLSSEKRENRTIFCGRILCRRAVKTCHFAFASLTGSGLDVIGPRSTKMADTMVAYNRAARPFKQFSRLKRKSVRLLNIDTRFHGICRPFFVILDN